MYEAGITHTEKPCLTRRPRSEEVDDPGRFPDLRFFASPVLRGAHSASGISGALAAYSCGGSSGFGFDPTGFPFNRSFLRHLYRDEKHHWYQLLSN